MQMAFNAQKIYVIKTGQEMTFLQFMKNLVLSCLTILEGLPENMSPDENVICLTSCHFPSCCYQTQTQKTSNQWKSVEYVMQKVIDQQEEVV